MMTLARPRSGRTISRRVCRPGIETLEGLLLLSGGFSPTLTYPVDRVPYSIAVGDFNSDGAADVAVLTRNPQDLYYQRDYLDLYLNRGDGTFGAPIERTVPSGAVRLATGDFARFAGDGRTEILVAGDPIELNVYELAPGGSIVPVWGVPGAYGLRDVAVADFNGDGKLDIAAVSTIVPRVSIWHGNGDGTFGAPEIIDFKMPQNSYASLDHIVAGDFDGDGRLDIAVSTQGYTTHETLATVGSAVIYQGLGVFVMQNKPDGTFDVPAHYDVPGKITGLAGGDLNHDGRADLIVATLASASVDISVHPVPKDGVISSDFVVLPGRKDGTLGAAAVMSASGQYYDPVFADLTGTGNSGIAAIQQTADSDGFSSRLVFFPGLDDGTLSPQPSYPMAQDLSAPAWTSFSFALADFDRDGRPDIAFAGNTKSGNMLGVTLSGLTSAPTNPTPSDPKPADPAPSLPVVPSLPPPASQAVITHCHITHRHRRPRRTHHTNVRPHVRPHAHHSSTTTDSHDPAR